MTHKHTMFHDNTTCRLPVFRVSSLKYLRGRQLKAQHELFITIIFLQSFFRLSSNKSSNSTKRNLRPKREIENVLMKKKQDDKWTFHAMQHF